MKMLTGFGKFLLQVFILGLIFLGLMFLALGLYETAHAETGLPSSYNGEIVLPSEVFNELDVDNCVITVLDVIGGQVSRGCENRPETDLGTIICHAGAEWIVCPVPSNRVVYKPGMKVQCPAVGGDRDEADYKQWADGCSFLIPTPPTKGTPPKHNWYEPTPFQHI